MSGPYDGRGISASGSSRVVGTGSLYSGRGFSVNRYGKMARAVNVPSEVPRYGMTDDMVRQTVFMSDQDEFEEFARTTAEYVLGPEMKMADLRIARDQYRRELEIAQNYQRLGYSMEDSKFNTDEDSFLSDVQTGFNSLTNMAGQLISEGGDRLHHGLRGEGFDEYVPTFEEYNEVGGLLFEEDWEDLNDNTKAEIFRRANIRNDLGTAAQVPFVKDLLSGLDKVNRFGITTLDQVSNMLDKGSNNDSPNLLKDIGLLFDGEEWERNWRESDDRSLGNAILDVFLAPTTSEAKLRDWQKHNAAYQMSSVAAELGALWYLDPAVIAVRGAAQAKRLARRELPLGGRMQDAVVQAMQGRTPTSARTRPGKAFANAYASRMLDGWDGALDYIKTHDLPTVARLPMFSGHRADKGFAAAAMLKEAVDSGDERLIDLSQRALFNDGAAIREINDMKMDPGTLDQYGPSGASFLEAWDSAKTRATQLENEVLELRAADAAGTGSRFHRWEVHTDLEVKEAQLDEVKSALDETGTYKDWLTLTDNNARIRRTGVTRRDRARVDAITRMREGEQPRVREFMHNPLGFMQTKIYNATTPRPGTANLHDIDSVFRSLTNWTDQVRIQTGFHVPDDVTTKIFDEIRHADTQFDVFKSLYRFEHETLPVALAQHFGLDPEVVGQVLKVVDGERDNTLRGLITGKGQVYEAGEATGSRVLRQGGTARVVGEDPDTNMLTVEFLDGKRLYTSEIHKSELMPRGDVPVDPTQTPNWYKMADIRQLVIEMSRNRELLSKTDAGMLRRGGAEAMKFNDVVMTGFYNMWKPLQLLRPGWPQRVLMDEAARALSIFGPMYLLNGPGGEAISRVARPDMWVDAVRGVRDRRGLKKNLGSPEVTAARVRPTEFEIDELEAVSPQIPAHTYPSRNKDDLLKIKARAAAGVRTAELTERVDAAQMLLDEKIPVAAGNTEFEMRAYARQQAYLDERASLSDLDIIRRLYHLHNDTNPDVSIRGSQVYVNPATLEPLKDGYMVPLTHIPGVNLKFDTADTTTATARAREISYWYARNADLLSRQGIHLAIDKDGNIQVVRRFKKFGLAKQFVKEMVEATDVGAEGLVKMFDAKTGDEWHVAARDELSPFMEAVYRNFHAPKEFNRLEDGTTPAVRAHTGEPETRPVYHGSDTLLEHAGLGEDGSVNLVPIEDNADSGRLGNMVGPGLYVTVAEDVAVGYGAAFGPYAPERLFTIRDSRTGEVFETFNADRAMREKDLRDLVQWIDDNWEEVRARNPRLSYDKQMTKDVFTDAFYRARRNRGLTQTRKIGKNSGTVSWGNVWESIDDSDPTNIIITQYLRSQGYGALTHKGGKGVAAPPDAKGHDVYVFFEPENIELRPLYERSTEPFRTIEEVLANPRTQATPPGPVNRVPENRIIRYGQRNPMLVRLHTIHAKREAGDDSPELLEQERGLMEALGLRYTSDTPKAIRSDSPAVVKAAAKETLDEVQTPNALGQDWYRVEDAGKFNRMMDEALALNSKDTEARDWAAAVNGEMRAEEFRIAALDAGFDEDALDAMMDDQMTRTSTRMRKQFGAGHTTLAHAETGDKIHVDNAFQGAEGDMFRGLTGSESTVHELAHGQSRRLSKQRTIAAGYEQLHPPVFNEFTHKPGTKENKAAVHYFQQYAELINRQIAHSPIWSRMLNGKSDEEIIDWLNNTDAGYKARKAVGRENQSIELWVNEHRAKFDRYVPSDRIRNMMRKGYMIEPSTLRRYVADEDLPDIYGMDVEMLTGNFVARTVDFMWKALGTVPIDALSRHPFAKAVYDQEIRHLVNQMDAKYLDNEMVERLQGQARTRALNEVRTHLFNIADGGNFTDAVRFLAPFWNAQQEALVKWARIISDRPETVVRWLNGQEAVYANFVVTDQNGEEVKSTYTPFRPRSIDGDKSIMESGMWFPEDRVLVSIPDWLAESRFGKALGMDMLDTRIPIGSANVVLQGEHPLMPGLGPIVSVPLDKFLRATDDVFGVDMAEQDWYEWIFPVGRPKGGWRGVMEQMLPGWGRRIQEMNSPEDGLSKVNLMMLIGREMILEAEKNGDPRPDSEDIARAANRLWMLKTFVSFGSPVQIQFTPKNQFWIDEAHRMQRELGPDWFDSFIETYGKEAALYAISSSNSVAGVPPTSQGMREFEANKDLVSKFPKWGEAMMSPLAWMDTFNYDAYEAQFEIPIGPGMGPMREASSLDERFAESERRIGWHEYRSHMASVEAEMYREGYTSLRVKAAEDLNFEHQQYLRGLRDKYPAWAEDYDAQENDIYSRVDELYDFAFDKRFDTRPDIKGVRRYLALRQDVADELDGAWERSAGRVSRSLEAEENTALRTWFYDNVTQIVQDNPAFAEFYTRYLSTDTLERGGG